MTLADVDELCAYWADHPPVHLSVAAFLGINADGNRKPASASSSSRPPASAGNNPAAAASLAAMPGLQNGDIHQGLVGPVVLSFMR